MQYKQTAPQPISKYIMLNSFILQLIKQHMVCSTPPSDKWNMRVMRISLKENNHQ